MGSSHSKPQQSRKPQQQQRQRKPQQQQQRKPQRQQQSQPQQQRAVLRRKPQYEFHRIKPEDYNVFWLNGGREGIIDEALLKAWGCNKCVLCNIRMWTAKTSLIHNIEGCKASYHSHCMRGYLEFNFQDKKGRLTRPRCYRCHESIDVRFVPDAVWDKDRALRKKNPTGWMKF